MAASFIMSVPVVVLFLVLQKYFVQRPDRGRGEVVMRNAAIGGAARWHR